MIHTIDEKTTKQELKEMLEQLPEKRKPVDFSAYFGKLNLSEDFDVIEWQRRNRDDGTYSY